MNGWNRPETTEHLPADREIWLISDLHLGDGTPSDVFFGKDKHLLALVETVEKRGATLVVNGDAMDFHQAWSFTRILRAHQEVLSAMSRLGREGRLFYLVGNHDYDINLYKEVLNFRVCDVLIIGDHIKVSHGYEYDPYHRHLDLAKGQWSTKAHHMFERYLQTWVRIPLGEFYTLPNRFVFWLSHKAAVAAHAYVSLMKTIGYARSSEHLDRHLDFWARSNMGDPMCMFPDMWNHLNDGPYDWIVCGHSHLPGVVPNGKGRAYVNTGSWTFASSHYARWDGERFRSFDWISGHEFQHHFYTPCLDGSLDEKDFWQWWRENYMGLLRFREGEERKGRLRNWESYVRDHQQLSQLPQARLRSLATAEQAMIPDETALARTAEGKPAEATPAEGAEPDKAAK